MLEADDTLDPAVAEATGQGPAVSTNDVTDVKPHDVDPAWSVVTFADGRTETMPTAQASALPQAPVARPPGNVPFAAGPGPQVADPNALTSVGAPGALPTQSDLVGGVQNPGGGAGFQDLGVRVDTSGSPGQLPPAQVDPGAAVAAPGDASGSTPYGSTDSVAQTTEQTVADPQQLAADVSGEYQGQAARLDAHAQGVQDAANAENRALLQNNEERQHQVADDLRKAQIHTEEAQKVVDAIESTPIEQDFFKDSPGRQVAAWLALATSGFLQGATKGANPALNQMMNALNGAQERFIANQKANKNSKLALRTRLLGDAQTAEASIRMQYGKLLDDHARTLAKQVGLDALPPAISTASASFQLKATEAKQQIGMHVERRTDERHAEERRAAPPGPQFQGDRELQALGVDRKAHAEAMDPKGANLGGMVQGAQRLAKIQSELEAIAKRHGGDLPSQNLVSWDSVGASKLAARMGSDSAKDQVRTRQLLEEAKLAFKQTINIKSVDSENEGKNFNAMMDTGETSTTLQALRDKANETNQRAVATASGFSRNPQGYLQFIERTLGSNPGVGPTGGAPQPKRSTGFRVEGGPAPAEPQAAAPTGGGPAPSSPLAQSPSASAPGSPTASNEDPVKLQTLQALKDQATKAGLDGDALTRIVRFESGGRADARNAASGATGLIQWMPEVFKGMTKPAGYENVRHEDLKDLTAEEQIPLVIQYFKDKGLKPGADVGEMYLAVAAPSAVNKPDSTVVYKKGSAAWTKNPAWRPADGGDITAGSIRAAARRF